MVRERSAADEASAPDRRARRREAAGILLFAFATFALVAMTSYVEAPPPGADGANLCGEAGRRLAHAALLAFGYGAYLAVAVLYLWSLAWIGRRSVRLGPFRLLWFGLFLFDVAALFSHTFGAITVRLPDAGGLVGFEIARFVERGLALGPWGTRLLLVVGALVTFQFATDFALYDLVCAAVRFLEERRRRAVELVQGAGPLFSSLLRPRATVAPAAAAALDARAHTSGSRRRRASSSNAEIGVTDEEVEGFSDDRDEEGEGEGPSRRRPLRRRRRGGLLRHDADDAALTPEEEARLLDHPALVEGGRGDDGKDAGGGEADEPPMLDADPESEIEPEPTEPHGGRRTATIRFDPPDTPAAAAPDFDRENTVYEPPPATDRVEYVFPSIDMLEEPERLPSEAFQRMVEHNTEVLETSLASYKVEAEVVEIQKGPVITMFEMDVAPGTRVDKIRSLEDDLAIRLKAPSVRIVAPIPGKSTIGIEVPNSVRETVRLRELVTCPEYDSSRFAVPVFLGKDAAGRPLIEDLAKMPHLLVAGATGAGKSVCLNTLIMSILFTRTPEQVKMILIDPKMVELSSFENIPHLMCPVVRDMNRAAQILEWAVAKMDERYSVLAEVGARNIFSYNKMPEEKKRERLGIDPDDAAFEARMPFIVMVVDELADLMMVSAKEVENHITRLAQKSRAVGIHIVLATQRPSTNVITGLIKANMPTRISFQVASKIDSRVVLDQNGAEKLLGQGDMLYMPPRTSMLVRAQGAFVSDEEIRAVVDAVKTERPSYARELLQKNRRAEVDPREVDPLYEDAVRLVVETRRGSASLLQRKFAIGYTRASRLIDLMAEDGILGEYRNAQAREVLVAPEELEARLSGASDGGGGT